MPKKLAVINDKTHETVGKFSKMRCIETEKHCNEILDDLDRPKLKIPQKNVQSELLKWIQFYALFQPVPYRINFPCNLILLAKIADDVVGL